MSELFQTGITITCIGMGVVLAFLTLMIFVMNIASGLIVNVLNKYFPETVKEEPKKNKKTAIDDSEIALAIAITHNAQQGGR